MGVVSSLKSSGSWWPAVWRRIGPRGDELSCGLVLALRARIPDLAFCDHGAPRAREARGRWGSRRGAAAMTGLNRAAGTPGVGWMEQSSAPPTADRRHSPSCHHPEEDPRAPGPLPFGAEPRARVARVLIRSSRAAAEAAVWAPRGVTAADPALATYSTCRLTAEVRPRSIALSPGGAAGARRGRSCALCLRLQRGSSVRRWGVVPWRNMSANGSAPRLTGGACLG
jgi:hypothetical protein